MKQSMKNSPTIRDLITRPCHECKKKKPEVSGWFVTSGKTLAAASFWFCSTKCIREWCGV
jgi:hypothetical protein